MRASEGAAGAAEARSDRIVTVPNALSVVRLLGVPVLLWLIIIGGHDGWALLLLMASGATDWLDGKLARLLRQQSNLGKVLDPAVDRIYLIAILIGFVVRDIVPWPLAAALVLREVLLAPTLLVYARRNLPPAQVLYLGKAATFILMMAAPALLAAQLDWPIQAAVAATATAALWWGSALYLWTGYLYLHQAFWVRRTVPVPAQAS